MDFGTLAFKICKDGLDTEQQIMLYDKLYDRVNLYKLNDNDKFSLLCCGLSIIYMNYPALNIIKYKDIVKEHSSIFKNWKPNTIEDFVINEIEKINNKE